MHTEPEVLSRTCRLAGDYQSRDDISPWRLMLDSGYPDMRAVISEAKIEDFVRVHPEVIDQWLAYSADKRCGGWYFLREEDGGRYVLGCIEAPGEDELFEEPVAPCAKFIKRELESMATE